MFHDSHCAMGVSIAKSKLFDGLGSGQFLKHDVEI